MTLWHLGRETDWGQACLDSKIIQYPKGKYLIEVGLCADYKLWYVIHYWTANGQTLHTKPSLVRSEIWSQARSLEGFRYERDGYLQIKILMEAGKSRWIWMPAGELEEIKELEKPP